MVVFLLMLPSFAISEAKPSSKGKAADVSSGYGEAPDYGEASDRADAVGESDDGGSGDSSGDGGGEGSEGDEGDSREFGAPARELPANARVEDIVEPSADYHYAGFGKADPFQPPYAIRAIVPDAIEIPIVSPLQRFALKDLKLVGVWARSSGDRKALVMTPTMEGIIVKVGDLVGSGGGKVMSISESAVLVREFLIANDGTRQFSDVRLIFTDKTVSGARQDVSGSIVISPGAAQADVQLQGGGPLPPSKVNGSAPVISVAVPANQTPSSILPALKIPEASPSGSKTGAESGSGAKSLGVPSGNAPGTSGTQNMPAKSSGNGSSFNY